MKSYEIENGAICIEVEKNNITRLDLIPGHTAPDTIHIPKEIDNCVIKTIGDGMDCICSNPQLAGVSFVIDDKISFIKEKAFSGMVINELHWPACCKEIHPYCFYRTKIKSLIGIENVLTIKSWAFHAVYGLKEFIIPDRCEELEEGAFSESEIERIVGGENLISLGLQCFSNCQNLHEMKWFPKVHKIPNGSFFECSNLEKVTGVEHVTVIGDCAFWNAGLTEFVWPDNCQVIPSCCFADCQKLSKIYNLHAVTEICSYAFENCLSLSEFQFPELLQTISLGAFRKTGLTEVDLSETMVEVVGKESFVGCKKLQSFIPSIYCSHLGESAFEGTPLKSHYES